MHWLENKTYLLKWLKATLGKQLTKVCCHRVYLPPIQIEFLALPWAYLLPVTVQRLYVGDLHAVCYGGPS